MSNQGWIGVDLDGTLAHYDHWRGEDHIGEPIPLMLERVKQWIIEGKRVKIFTARVSNDTSDNWHCTRVVEDWCKKHIGVILDVTCKKDYGMIELWDDRCVQVVKNTGERVGQVEPT